MKNKKFLILALSLVATNAISVEYREKTKSGKLDEKIKNTVGIITSLWRDKNREVRVKTCTATLVSRKMAITSASCLFLDDGRYTPIEVAYFSPGALSLRELPNHRFPVEKSFFPRAYKDSSYSVNDDNDIALIELGKYNEKYPGDLNGWTSYWGKNGFEQETGALSVSYPADKADKNSQYYEKGCRISKVSEKSFRSDCIFKEGHSGAPHILYSEKYKLNYIIGVASSKGEGKNDSRGSLITPERQKIIAAIIDWTYAPNDFDEAWTMQYHHVQKSYNVFVRNECSLRKAKVAIHYKNADDEWVTEGFTQLGKGESAEFVKAPHNKFYLSWTFDNGKTYSNNPDIRRKAPHSNMYIPFGEVIRYITGDYVEVIHCPLIHMKAKQKKRSW